MRTWLLLAALVCAGCGGKTVSDGGPERADGSGGSAVDASAAGGANGGGSAADASPDRSGQGGWYTYWCDDNDDCARFPATTVCDPDAQLCVECLPGEEDACGIEAFCDDENECVLGCWGDEDCPATGSCNLFTHRCTGCSEDSDCPLGTICDTDTGICIPGCGSGRLCPTDWTCCDGECASLFTSDEHCGACDSPCDELPKALVVCTNGDCLFDGCEDGYDDCDGNPDNGCETDVATDVTNCGWCGTACDSEREEVCNNGVCGLRCEGQEGWADCTDAPGCETNTLAEVNNCGGCNVTCELANATPECVGGQCAIAACDGHYLDCDQIVENGCEVDTQTNVDHCGACGDACSTANGSPVCTSGNCSIVCDAGFGDCDGNAGNGCEVDTITDRNNCGGCYNVCTNEHGTTSCANGDCVPVCAEGYGDCNGNLGDGCETDLNSDVNNCGGCGTACALTNATAQCQMGSCFYQCEVGFDDCDEWGEICETDLNSDVEHCGSCSAACSTNHATPSCSLGDCMVEWCELGWANCNDDARDGCEVNTAVSITDCGGCGNVCPSLPGAVPFCSLGSCGEVPCPFGMGNCNGDAADGCEITLNLDVNHCGACGNACATVAHATPTCADGLCAIGRCDVGWGDCNNDYTDGCETSVTDNINHCGACHTACIISNGSTSCVDGECRIVSCQDGYGDCDGDPANGCETDLDTDPWHCGHCGNVCWVPFPGWCNHCGLVFPDCWNGSCVDCYCWLSTADCDNDGTCETDLAVDPNHCGACFNACSLPHATAACSDCECIVSECDLGWADCDSVPANGCETNPLSDANHCGQCGNDCGAGNCVAGVCQ